MPPLSNHNRSCICPQETALGSVGDKFADFFDNPPLSLRSGFSIQDDSSKVLTGLSLPLLGSRRIEPTTVQRWSLRRHCIQSIWISACTAILFQELPSASSYHYSCRPNRDGSFNGIRCDSLVSCTASMGDDRADSHSQNTATFTQTSIYSTTTVTSTVATVTQTTTVATNTETV